MNAVSGSSATNIVREDEPAEAPSPEDSSTPQSQADSRIKIGALKELTLALLKEVESLVDTKASENRQHICLQNEVRRFESDLIRCALVRTGGHQRRAARLLGIKVTTLNAKIKRYGIHPAPPIVHTQHNSYFDERSILNGSNGSNGHTGDTGPV